MNLCDLDNTTNREVVMKTILVANMTYGDAVIREIPDHIYDEIEADFDDGWTEELVNKWREKLLDYPIIHQLPAADYDFIY